MSRSQAGNEWKGDKDRAKGGARGEGANRGPTPDRPIERAAETLRALSHPVRLRIVQLLAEGEVCVKGLEEVLGISQPSVSQHLARLRYAGLIEFERRGHLVCYRLASDRASRILAALLKAGTEESDESS